MTIEFWKLVAASLLAAAECVQATPNVTITPSNGGTWSYTTVNGREAVTLTRNASVSGTVDFALTGSSTEAFDVITVVTNNAADLTTVHITGTSTGSNTGSAESICRRARVRLH